MLSAWPTGRMRRDVRRNLRVAGACETHGVPPFSRGLIVGLTKSPAPRQDRAKRMRTARSWTGALPEVQQKAAGLRKTGGGQP